MFRPPSVCRVKTSLWEGLRRRTQVIHGGALTTVSPNPKPSAMTGRGRGRCCRATIRPILGQFSCVHKTFGQPTAARCCSPAAWWWVPGLSNLRPLFAPSGPEGGRPILCSPRAARPADVSQRTPIGAQSKRIKTLPQESSVRFPTGPNRCTRAVEYPANAVNLTTQACIEGNWVCFAE